jgi:hypothetical protein
MGAARNAEAKEARTARTTILNILVQVKIFGQSRFNVRSKTGLATKRVLVLLTRYSKCFVINLAGSGNESLLHTYSARLNQG